MAWERFKPTKEYLVTPRPCKACGKLMTEADLKKRQLQKGARVKEALAMAKHLGEPVGRPRTRDDAKIRELREQGKTIRAIAAELKCSTWSVNESLKALRAKEG